MSYKHNKNTDADVLIILGSKIYSNTPTLMLVSRLDAAVEYVKTCSDIPIIVSGGQGTDEKVSEAEAMFRYLVASGVDENRIWKEDASVNTRENISFSIKLMKYKGLDVANLKVAVLSNEFHLFRTGIIAKKAGLEIIPVAAKTPGLLRRIYHYMREVLALGVEVLTG